MGFFDLFKSKISAGEVWRNSSGEIECPGDSCPKKCDSTCPIYLNKYALLHINGDETPATTIYEKVLKIAPDYYAAWINLAGTYAEQGDLEKAYDCYLKALELEPDNGPLFELARVTRDLKRYDESIKWCDEYNKLSNSRSANGVMNYKVDKIREEAVEALKQASRKKEGTARLQSGGGEKPTVVMANQVLFELIKNDLDNGLYIEEQEPIGELANEGGHITHEIFDYVKDYYISEANKGNITEEDLSQYIFHISMLWSVLAGIGAMELWTVDRESLMNQMKQMS